MSASDGRTARTRVLIGVAAWLWALAPATPAAAYEDQASVGLGVGYAHAFESPPAHGLWLGLSGSLGLSQTLSARAVLGYGLHPDDAPRHVATAGAEIVYLVDVLELVPWLGLGADGALRARGDAVDPEVAAHAVLGLDYLWSRELTLSLELRPYVWLTALDAAPVYGTVSVGLSWMLDT